LTTQPDFIFIVYKDGWEWKKVWQDNAMVEINILLIFWLMVRYETLLLVTIGFGYILLNLTFNSFVGHEGY